MSPDEQIAAYRDALQMIAASVTTARRRASRMGVLPAGAGEDLMCDVEHALTSLIALGVVQRAPAPPAPPRPPTILRGDPRALE